MTKNFLGSFPERKKKLLKKSLNIEINQESDEILDLRGIFTLSRANVVLLARHLGFDFTKTLLGACSSR